MTTTKIALGLAGALAVVGLTHGAGSEWRSARALYDSATRKRRLGELAAASAERVTLNQAAVRDEQEAQTFTLYAAGLAVALFATAGVAGRFLAR